MNYPADYVPTQEDKKFADGQLELARLIAATQLPHLLNRLIMKADDPTTTAKQIQDAAEFTYRVSGLAKRQEEVDDRGKFVFNINFSGQKLTVSQPVVIEGEPREEPTQKLPMHLADIESNDLPADVLAFTNDLDLSLDGFDD